MSRYLVQMKYSPLFKPRFRTVHITVGRSRMIPERLAKETVAQQAASQICMMPVEREQVSFAQRNKYLGELPDAILLQVCM